MTACGVSALGGSYLFSIQYRSCSRVNAAMLTSRPDPEHSSPMRDRWFAIAMALQVSDPSCSRDIWSDNRTLYTMVVPHTPSRAAVPSSRCNRADRKSLRQTRPPCRQNDRRLSHPWGSEISWLRYGCRPRYSTSSRRVQPAMRCKR